MQNKPISIVFTVINDLNFDQRMQRICTSLAEAGFEVTLVGRVLPGSPPLSTQPFAQVRLKLFFTRGKLFYIEYNLRLLIWLLRRRFDIYSATDLDTLLPQYLAAKWQRKPIVYDAHEYFPELPEIVHRPFTHWVWQTIERIIVPRLRYAYTINTSYADIFRRKYGVVFGVVRNAAVLRQQPLASPAEPPYILYQGAVNVGRGIEQMIAAMPLLPECNLYICGTGDVFDDCVALVQQLELTERVRFLGRVPPAELRQITAQAFLGFTFFTQQGMSYYLSLANRFFDYFHAGIPQLCSAYPEYLRINAEYEIAQPLPNLEPATIAQAVQQLLQDPEKYKTMQQNCLAARQYINWQREAQTLLKIYEGIVCEMQE